jgi:MIP family channel proteins
MQPRLSRILVAEAIGAFTLTFIGVLVTSVAALIGAPPGVVTITTAALAQGLAIGVMVAALGHISGGHFNPAITFGFVVARRMTPLRGLFYWLAQLAGAIIAAAILLPILGHPGIVAGTPALITGLGWLPGTILEGIGTFFLVYVVFGTVVDKRAPGGVYPFAIGLTIAICIMAFGLLTGSAVNPSRAFGPALISGTWTHQYMYWIGPLIGGGIAGALYQWFLRERGAGVITIYGEEEAPRRAA